MPSKTILGAKAASAAYIEDVFSTYLYAGTAGDSTITNGIDLSGKGGLVWIKARTQVGGLDQSHALFDTARGATKFLSSNNASAATTEAQSLKSFTSTGFTLGGRQEVNGNAATYTSWTFCKQAKFFDVQTSATGATPAFPSTTPSMSIQHNLGSVPGCVLVRNTSAGGGWYVYHRSVAAGQYLQLQSTGASINFGGNVNGTGSWIQVTSTHIYLDSWFVSFEPGSFVVYAFAHDAGGFGAAGTDNVISCGTFTGVQTINLGYEPQWLMIKRTDATSNWFMYDIMRGWTSIGTDNTLEPSTSAIEATYTNNIAVSSTGFTSTGATGTWVYVVIRRGPMRTPTSGASVFTPIKTGSGATLSDSYSSIGFPIDMTLRYQTGTDTLAAYKNAVYTRLLGINSGITNSPTSANNPNLLTHSTNAIATTWYYAQTGSMGLDYGGSWNAPAYVLTHLHFRRAPGFFDVVCYTGTGANRTVKHNLGVAPELMIVKGRTLNSSWRVYANNDNTDYLVLNNSDLTIDDNTVWNDTSPTATEFTVGTSTGTNSTFDYVAYLFATCPGVSKVGSYTGTGTTLQINCGFTTGARFVMIKRTDATGDWYVWDSARGIVAGNDPYLLLNSTAAEVTNTDYVDTYSAGFEISSTAPAAINGSGGTFIFLAVA